MGQCFVTVLMTAYNREKYIAEAIESVLASTYTEFELFIVDDRSTDNTLAIAKEYEAKDQRIRVFANEINLKDYPNRNYAASLAKGKYIKYVDSDDTIYPWGLEAMVHCMERCPGAAYGLISYNMKSDKQFPILLDPVAAYYAFYFKGSMIITGPTGAIFNREIFEKVNGFSGKPYLGDTEMWLKLSKEYGLVAMPLDLVWWRQHDDQQFTEGMKNNYYENNRYHVLLDALKDPACPLTGNYKKQATRNLKNRYARSLLLDLGRGRVKRFFSMYKSFGLSIGDMLKCIRFNRYPPLPK